MTIISKPRGSSQTRYSASLLKSYFRKPCHSVRSSKVTSSATKFRRPGQIMVPGLSACFRQRAARLGLLQTGLRALTIHAATSEPTANAVVAATQSKAKKRGALTAYQIFTKDPLLQKELSGFTVGDRSKKSSEKWKSLSPEEKAKYEKEAELGGRLKKAKVTSRGTGGYNRFVQDWIAKNKKTHPDTKSTDLFKKAAADWRSLTEAEKTKWK